MEEDDYTTKKKVYCNHGLVVRLKTSWTSNNPGRRYWSCPYYGGPRSCNFWCWKDKENIDPRSKFVIPKLIQKLVTEEVDKPGDFKQDDDCLACCCVVVISISYWFWVIYMKKGSMKLP
ncbi:hypothetical protein KY285_020660 [Solanum tuberosum]|nr:hypothetical protein KY285_020660 [Solanum tuberosum]